MSADNFNHMEQEIDALSSEAETYYRKNGGTIGGNTELTQTVVHNQNTVPLIIRRGNTSIEMSILKKPYVKRALRTFAQTVVGYIAVNIAATDLTVKSAALGLAVSAISAGLAAVMNLKEE